MAGAYNVFLGNLVLALFKDGTFSHVKVASMLEKQESANECLPANYAFNSFAQRLRLTLFMPSRGHTPGYY